MTRNKRLKKCLDLIKKYHISPKLISMYTGIGLRTAQYWIAGEREPSDEMLESMEEILQAIDQAFKC